MGIRIFSSFSPNRRIASSYFPSTRKPNYQTRFCDASGFFDFFRWAVLPKLVGVAPLGSRGVAGCLWLALGEQGFCFCQPVAFGKGVGAEGFLPAFSLVAEEGAVQA